MVVVAAAIAAGLSVVLASLAFVARVRPRGRRRRVDRAVFTAMIGVHALIGIGEAVITASR